HDAVGSFPWRARNLPPIPSIMGDLNDPLRTPATPPQFPKQGGTRYAEEEASRAPTRRERQRTTRGRTHQEIRPRGRSLRRPRRGSCRANGDEAAQGARPQEGQVAPTSAVTLIPKCNQRDTHAPTARPVIWCRWAPVLVVYSSGICLTVGRRRAAPGAQ